MASTMKKHFSRLNQAFSQSIGRAEKSEVISEELQQIDQRVETMVGVLKHTRKKLIDCLHSKKVGSTKDDIDKRKLAFEEYKLSQTVLGEAKNVEALYSGNLLSDVMSSYGDVMATVVDDMVKYEMQIEQLVLEKLAKFSEDMEILNQEKDKLKKLGLDMDSAKSKLTTAQTRGDERVNEIQDEFDSAYTKVENHKDSFAVNLYTLASKEVEMAGLFRTLLQVQLEYHRNSLSRLEGIEPAIMTKIDSHPRRPVYGLALDDHLRYSRRDVALVLDVCCSALVELGLKDEGLFRIPGNATKVRKLKAAFDAGEIDLSDIYRDPHSVAGALKLYLRELPDPVMCGAFYNDWIRTIDIPEPEGRISAMRDVIAKLPKSNLVNLQFLIKFLSKLLENQAHTKMSSQNLAIVMAPNMIWNPVGGEGFGLNNAHGILVELLMTNADYFFPEDVQFGNSHSMDNFGSGIENGAIPKQNALYVDVSFRGSRGASDESLDKQFSPARGSRKSRPPPPPPPASTNISPQFKFSDQRPTRASFHSLPSGRPSVLKAVDIPDLPVPATTTVGHKKSNSLGRPLEPPLLTVANSKDVKDLSMNESTEQVFSTSAAELTTEDLSKVGDNDQLQKSATLPRPHPQQRMKPPIPAKSSTLHHRSGNGTVNSNALTATTVRVSDDSDNEEPVMNEIECVKRGELSPGSRSRRQQISPKEISYITVLEEGDDIEQQPVVVSELETSGEQMISPQNSVPMRPRPPVPSKPRISEVEMENIIRL